MITARGGSKRVPGKNLRCLGGRPVLVWSIEVAQAVAEISEEISDILVSTDDAAIAAVARSAGALVPWLRPAEVATDTASSVDVCLHALDWYESETGEVDGLLLLQPTSPFRRRDTVLRGIDLFRAHHRRPVLTISPAASHPMWCFRLEGAVMRPYIEGGIHLRSQDLPPAYVLNGALHLIAPEDLRQRRSFYGDDMLPLVLDAAEESIDIDSEWDWKMAEAVLLARGAAR